MMNGDYGLDTMEDSILSLSDPTYRHILEGFFIRLGPKMKGKKKKVNESELTEAEAAEEVFNIFKNKGGRLMKRQKDWREKNASGVVAVDDEEARKKIRTDIRRRMESAKRWLVADSEKDSPNTATESPKKAKSRNTRSNNSTNNHTQQLDQQASCSPSNMIKVGSRVLVSCGVDESWFKATVHKHREDNGAKRSFLVHFDGNRKTNQSWINEEQIAGILFHRESTTNSDNTLPTAASDEEPTAPCQFDPLGADDIRERLRMQEARIDALVASHADINTKVTTFSDQMTSQNNVTSRILTDYNIAISKLQDGASQYQEEIKRIHSSQDTRKVTINVVQREVVDLSRKLEDESGDLRLHLDGLVGQVAALRREIKDIQSNVEGELGCLRDDSHHKALENKTLQDLVTEVVNQSIENNPTIAKIVHDNKRFTAKVTDMSVCSKNHHEGLSNHAQALRELQSEHKGTRATTDKFNEVMHDLSKQCIFTATQLNRIELQETENEAKVDAGFQKVFSEIEYLKSLITGPSNCTRSAHITLKRKSPDPDSMSTEDPEGERLPKLRSIDPKSTPQSNSSLEPSYQSTSYEQETSPSSQCEFNDKSLLDSRDVSSEIDDKNEPNSLAPSFNFANPSFFFQADVSAATPSNANANASNTFGSGESACGFTFGSTSATFGSSIRSPSPLGGSALLSTNEKSGTSAVFGSSSAFSGGFDSLALSNSVQSFGSDQATEAKTEEPSSQAQATATTPFGSGAAIPSFGSQKANPFGSFATSSGRSSSGDGEKASVGAQEESEITVTQRGYNIDDDMSIMDLYLLGKKKKEDSESNQKASSLQHDEVQKKEDSKQAVVSSLQSNDVLLGRGGNTWKHHGNEQLRKMALERAAQYASLTKKEKSTIMRDILREVKESRGRFLVKDPKTEEWKEVSDEVAREKVAQVLRDNVKSSSEQTAQKNSSRQEVVDLTSSEDKDSTESNFETDDKVADGAAILSFLV